MELPNSILIILPHPDDEALLTGGIIRRAILENKKVAVCIVTNGDYLCHNFTKGEARLKESYFAMKSLGLNSDRLFLLGFPDTGFEPEVSFINALKNATDENQVYPSLCSTKTYGISNLLEDYGYLRTGEHLAYCRCSLEWSIMNIINETTPDLIITTSEWDIHGDHSALSFFVRNAIKTSIKDITLYEGIVHSWAGDDVWPIRESADKAFTIIPNLELETSLKWENRISISLPADMLQNQKLDKKMLIKSYETALNPDEPDVIKYLLSFAKSDEIFWEIKL